MICKDCLAKLSPDGSVDYVELCARHAEAEALMDTAGALVAHLDDEQRERRRYALLQAAARLIGPILIVLHDDEVYQKRIRQGVDAAEALLAEIEQREKAKDLLIKALNAAIQERGGQ